MQRSYILPCVFMCLLGAQSTWAATFYDVLKADPQHKLIMRAVDSDPEGKLKRMLQDTVPLTAFVPVDSAFIRAAIKLKVAKPADTAAFLKNHCLIQAILKQHMVPGRFDTATLKSLSSRPSMLVTKKALPNSKGQVTVSWPVKFSASPSGEVSVASVAKVADPSSPGQSVPATSAQLVAPYDIQVGEGLIHNINGLLLPMTNLTRLMQVAGCKQP